MIELVLNTISVKELHTFIKPNQAKKTKDLEPSGVASALHTEILVLFWLDSILIYHQEPLAQLLELCSSLKEIDSRII